MQIRSFFLALLTFAMASFLLLHFGLIWLYGSVEIYESNTLILTVETIMMVAIIGFSLYCTAGFFRRAR